MSFDWKDYQAHAHRICNQPHADAADYRSCISRSYYAVFGTLRRKLQMRKMPSAHQALIQQLREVENVHGLDHLDDDEIRYMADQIEHLRNERNKADYDAFASISREHSRSCLQKAQEILDMMEDY